MHATIPAKQLKDALSRAEKVTAKQSQLAVLTCVLVIAEKKTIILRATNLDIGLEMRIPAKVTSEGVVAVPAATFAAFVSQVSDTQSLTLDANETVLSVSGTNTHTQIQLLPYEDFPTLPHIEQPTTLAIPASDLATGLTSVWYSASPSSMKPELASVYIGADDGVLVCTATDSFRLAEKRIVVKKLPQFEPLLMPIKNIPEIIRTLESISGTITIAFNDNQLSMSADGLYLTTRLVDGVFPDYTQIVPAQFSTEVVLLKHDLVQALKITNVFSNTFNQTTFVVNLKHKSLAIQTRNPDVGESDVAVDAAVSGESLTIGFNHKYITDSFQTLTTDSIALKFNGVGKPLVITNVGDTSFMYLVMPMNR